MTQLIFQTGTVRGTVLAVEHMRKDKGGEGGVIINVASAGGKEDSVLPVKLYKTRA